MSLSYLVMSSLLIFFVSFIGVCAQTSTAPLIHCNIPCMTQALLHPNDVASCSLCAIPTPPSSPPYAAATSTPSSLLAEARANADRLHQGDPDPNGILLSLQRIRAQLFSSSPQHAVTEADLSAPPSTPQSTEESEIQFYLATGWVEVFGGAPFGCFFCGILGRRAFPFCPV